MKKSVLINKAESEVLKAYLQGKVYDFIEPINIEKSNGLGKGELAAISLYKKLSADLLLIDDARAKKVAYLNNLEVMGSLGVLLLAKKEGVISEIKPLLNLLRYSDIFVSEHILDQVLLMAGEASK
ncbi:MAG: DUF3368 domain-containing protein [Methylococcales bacterium]|nr:MAG: DUF3368 domain-containing protein [Methylococcales bacterium]